MSGVWEKAPSPGAVKVTPMQVSAFRLRRHHLARRAPASAIPTIVGDMAGAQAQVLSAAQMSIGARTRSARIEDLDNALWKERSLVRAWGMRRTMFLLPSDELALYARGSYRRSAYNLSWARERVGSPAALERVLDHLAEILDEPLTRKDIARSLESRGYRIESKAGGGWGDSRAVPWVEVGGTLFSVGFLIHVAAAQHVICSGPTLGNESTYVRAEKWLPHWKDIPVGKAEQELLAKYLRAYGPATLTDFAIWVGMYVRDAKEIWKLQEESMAPVEVEGRAGWVLRSDISDLEDADLRDPVVRLLPFFDSFLLGHKSHRDIVDEAHRKRVYRPQGWVSPVLLVDGRAEGVWASVQKGEELEVRIIPFRRLSKDTVGAVHQEASELSRFLQRPTVKILTK